MKQYALLFKRKSNLDLYLTNHGKVENGTFIGDVPVNSTHQKLGLICFESEMNHVDILREFGEKYLGHGELMHQAQENLWSVLSYPLSLESEIIQAFVNHFSKDKLI